MGRGKTRVRFSSVPQIGKVFMCKRCKAKSGKDFCDPCLLVLEQFDSSYRSGVRLTTVEGFKAALRERTNARV